MPGSKVDFESRHTSLVARLKALRDPQERLSWIVSQVACYPRFDASDRTDDWLVPGCAARLWLRATLEDGRCQFAVDSDSAILKAMAGLLCLLYDGLPPEEVASREATYLEEAGLLRQLTDNRRRTILRVREVIREFALEHARTPEAVAR